MKIRAFALLLSAMALAALTSAFVQADSPVAPELCTPSASILYADFDEVIARVFIPDDCPVIGDGTMNPAEILESATVTLQRKAVAPGGDVNAVSPVEVASTAIDVTTINIVHAGGLLRKDVTFTIVPSYTTTDFHRVVFAVTGAQGADAFAERAASAWLAMPPPPRVIDGLTAPVAPTRPAAFGSLLSEETSTRGNG